MEKPERNDPLEKIRSSVQDSRRTQERFFAENLDKLREAFEKTSTVLRTGGKLLIIGNGGSAADAQHLAAELVNRYRVDRSPLPAIALTTDASILTSIGNDSDFRYLFSRQIEALGKPGDLLLAITTSGNSPNVLEGIRRAKEMGILTLALTGGGGGRAGELADLAVCVSSSRETPRIQETLLIVEHLLCEWVEWDLFSSSNAGGPQKGKTGKDHAQERK
jgi:D-sedoheptulose 7-phosphate isomerase